MLIFHSYVSLPEGNCVNPNLAKYDKSPANFPVNHLNFPLFVGECPFYLIFIGKSQLCELQLSVKNSPKREPPW